MSALSYLSAWETRVVDSRRRKLDGVEIANHDRLFPYQRESVQIMAERGRMFNLDTMGLGKTAQSISAMATLRVASAQCCKRHEFIVCPGYLRHNWGNELKTWWYESAHSAKRPADVVLVKSAKDFNVVGTGDKIFVITYDLLPRISIDYTGIGSVILDESQYVKNRETRRYKAVEPLCNAASAVFLLSGTPAPNCPREYFSQIQLMHPRMFDGKYYAFTDRYCAGQRDKFGHYDDRGSSREQELAEIVKRISIRRRREDLPELISSEVVTNAVTLEASGGNKRAFSKLEQEFKKLTRKIPSCANTGAARLASMKRVISEMFRFTCELKRAPVAEFVKDYMESCPPSEKVIFFCKHVSMVTAVSEAIAYPTIQITGSTPLGERTARVARFLDHTSPVRAAVLTLGSSATGLNLTPVSRMVFCELDFNPAIILQACARINRVKGSAESLEYTYLLCDGTLDEMVYKKMKRKTKLAELVVDGGCDYGEFV